MSKAFDKIADGLNDILEGNYTVHQSIPDDIMQAARECVTGMRGLEALPERIARAILAERLAERERCAQVAEGWPTISAGDEYMTNGNGRYWDAGTAYDQSRADAATAIRGQT